MGLRSYGSPRPPLGLEVMQNLEHHFAPTTIAAKRNTFTSSSLVAHPPAIDFKSAGAAAETNKLCEIPVEIIEATNLYGSRFLGPAQAIDWDYSQLFSCNHAGGLENAAQRTNVGDDAWTGIELFSAENNVIPAYNTLGTGFAQLRCRVNDPRNWQLVLRNSDPARLAQVKDFVVPYDGFAGNLYLATGNSIGLMYEVWGAAAGYLSVSAWVNGVMRAKIQDIPVPTAPFTLGNSIYLGLVVWSGTQTAAAQISAQWSGCRLTVFNSHQAGKSMM